MAPVKRTSQTDDRHDPTGRNDYLSRQHTERYAFARSRLQPDQLVLDIACGSGYGTEMLKEHGCRVVAGDLDAGELGRIASEKNLTDLVALNALHLPFPDNAFDAVVSFETVEHVVDGMAFLQEMRRVLKSGGLFISSTPNIKYTFHPAYHLKEYRPKEYYTLVCRVFGNATPYAQYYRRMDNVRDNARWLLVTTFRNFSSAKRVLKSIRNKIRSLRAQKSVNGVPSFSQPDINNFYCVKDYSSSNLLRIMVTVSTK